MPGHDRCLTASTSGLVPCHRCLGHQRPQFLVGGFVCNDGVLLLDLREFRTQRRQTFGRLREASFEEPAGHTHNARSRWHRDGAPSRIRTDTGRCLRPLPLPLGYRGDSQEVSGRIATPRLVSEG